MGQPCCFTTKTDEKHKMLLLEITNRCNLSCHYCHSYPNSGGNINLSIERLKLLVDECIQESFTSLVISGGEPLLNNLTFKLAQEAHEKEIKTDLCTNGTIINNEFIKKIHDYFDGVTVTLDTIDEVVYSKMKSCSPNMFHKAYNGLQSLVNAGVNVGVTIVITQYNYDNIYDTFNKLKSIGVHKVALLRLFTFNSVMQYDISYDQNNILILKTMLSEFKDMKVSLKGWDFVSYRCPQCAAGKSIFAVDYKGNLLPCIMIRNYVEPSNLASNSLKNAIKSSFINNIRNEIKKMTCNECLLSNKCNKGCPGVQYRINNEILADNRCDFRNSTEQTKRRIINC
jgi:radical SAM protein with 4Fe4S-binding SPASM domain